jgi:hypothetical protein
VKWVVLRDMKPLQPSPTLRDVGGALRFVRRPTSAVPIRMGRNTFSEIDRFGGKLYRLADRVLKDCTELSMRSGYD